MIGELQTFLITNKLIWTEGPPLKIPRYFSACGRIQKGEGSKELSVISAGGDLQEVYSDVVEVFDAGSTEWRSGPGLPFALARSEMVEDPLGGVILIGGHNSDGKDDAEYFGLAT